MIMIMIPYEYLKMIPIKLQNILQTAVSCHAMPTFVDDLEIYVPFLKIHKALPRQWYWLQKGMISVCIKVPYR